MGSPKKKTDDRFLQPTNQKGIKKLSGKTLSNMLANKENPFEKKQKEREEEQKRKRLEQLERESQELAEQASEGGGTAEKKLDVPQSLLFNTIAAQLNERLRSPSQRIAREDLHHHHHHHHHSSSSAS